MIYKPQERELMLRLAGAHKRKDIPEYDVRLRCEFHPKRVPLMAHGAAGGGIGQYTFCPACKRIVSKTEDP